MQTQNDPGAGSARAVECLLGSDIDSHTAERFRAQILNNRFGLPALRAGLISRLAWEAPR